MIGKYFYKLPAVIVFLERVMAFENFDEPDAFMFVKHHFYVMGDNGKVDIRVDSESSVAIRMNGSKDKYVLCLVKGESHFTL